MGPFLLKSELKGHIYMGKRYEVRRSTGNAFVYFIQSGFMGPIKIGVAVNVKRRMESLQAGNPVELKLIAKIPCPSVANAYALENKLHKRFHKKHIRGEWFKPTIRLGSVYEIDMDWDDESQNEAMKLEELRVAQTARGVQ